MNVSESVGRILNLANHAAGGKSKNVTPMHLLYACSVESNSMAAAYLKSEGITTERIASTPPSFFADKTAPEILALAEIQSARFDQPAIVSEALLCVLCSKCKQTKSAINQIRPGAAERILQKILNKVGLESEEDDTSHSNINVVKWATTDEKTAYKNPKFNYDYQPVDNTSAAPVTSPAPTMTQQTLPASMLAYGQDLTAKARQGKIDKIVGREDETNRLVEILCRKTKNNPVLIGEAGVGKSAIIEGLAKKIVDQQVPETLQNKIVFSLDIGLLLGGAKYRGELEGRLNQVLNELNSRDDIILFIDEIHNIVTSGNKEGEMSVGEILKPTLARGTLRCVGATTVDEYRKYIEKDPALERRFAPIMVYAPTPEQTVEILAGLVDGFEKFHKVRIAHSALTAAVLLSNRYIFDRNLPDKAIDVLDEACAKAKVKAGSGVVTITQENIAEVVATMTKIPLSKINASDQENLMNIEKTLQEKIIGQDKAIAAVAKAVRRSRSGITDANRPIGSFFFLGRTGVGKTEVCKQLSQLLYDNEKSFIKLDMSEFSEAHSVSKMVGAPPGYVGYDDGSALCDRVKHNPYCLVLFDEIEKAHPDIYNLMLQILDEGRLTNSHGKVVSFKNAIIVMTSNVGVSNLVGKDNLTPEQEEQILLAGMRKKFSPEFVNRIDNIVAFNTLTTDDVKKIVDLQLQKLNRRLRAVNVMMTYRDRVIDFIAETAYQKENGVRPIRHFIQKHIEDKISEQIITRQVREVAIDVVDQTITVQSIR